MLLYGVETWTRKANVMSHLGAFEMWVFRKILKIPWTDHTTNAEVLNLMARERELLQIVKRKRQPTWAIYSGIPNTISEADYGGKD